MIIQQIHFIDIQDTAVCSCQYSGFKCPYPFFDGFFDVQCTNDPVFSSSKWKINNTGSFDHAFQFFTIFHTLIADIAHFAHIFRVTVKRTVDYYFYLGKHVIECPYCSGFCTSLLPPDQNTTDPRINGI